MRIDNGQQFPGSIRISVSRPTFIKMALQLKNSDSIRAFQQSKKMYTSDFCFKNVTLKAIENEISNLNSSKQGTFKNIPTKCLKESSDICSKYLLNIWNNEIVRNGYFPDKLKLADVTPVFKKDDATQAKNYRPISVLPTISKVFERLIQKQLLSHIDQYLSPYLCGYRKG